MCAMFGFRYSSLFKSRWIALLWAASICWMAVSIAGGFADKDGNAAATDATGAQVSPDDIKRIADGLHDS